jgi:hypothetical protein
MDSNVETDQEQPKFEPVLEVVEGNGKGGDPEYAIVPDAFEQVMAKYEGLPEESTIPVEPFYKNRFFIGSVCAFAGLLVGHFVAEPKTIEKIVEQQKPVVLATNTPTPNPTKLVTDPQVKQPFRELKDSKEFDPWKPLNGGFPVPPKDAQERIASTMGPIRGGFSQMPAPEISGRPGRRTGPILPLDPGSYPGLPDQNGETGNGAADQNQNPKNSGETKTPFEDKVVRTTEKYVSVSMNGPDPESGQGRLVSIANGMGGSGRTFTHMTEEGSIEAQGVILIVPMAKFEDTKRAIERLGGASVDGEYNGVASRYQGNAQGIFSSRLAKLREKRKDLLVDFLEDAQPVKQITEAIDIESRAVSATRLGGNLTGMVVFRILLR